MYITLSPEEIKLATWIATLRDKHDRDSGVKDAIVAGKDALGININGMCGELAFCRAMNIYPDLDTKPRKGGYDCVDHEGSTYDVKTTKHPEGNLIAKYSKSGESVEYYALMIGEAPTYKFVGYVERDMLINDRTVTDFGYGPTYALSQQEVQHYYQDILLRRNINAPA